MGNTRRTRSTSHKLSLITLCATLSRTSLAASSAAAGEAANPGKPASAEAAADAPGERPAPGSLETTRFARAGRWVLGLEGLAALEYYRGAEYRYGQLDAERRSSEVKTRTNHLMFSTLAPRVGVHAFVADHLSVGLTAAYNQVTFTNDTTTEEGDTTSHNNTSRHLRMGPGAGLAYQHGSGFGVWARGALEVQTSWSKVENALGGGERSFATQSFGAGVQALATFTPMDALVLSFGPALHKNVASSGDISENGPRPEDEPPVLALVFGAGLVL